MGRNRVENGPRDPRNATNRLLVATRRGIWVVTLLCSDGVNVQRFCISTWFVQSTPGYSVELYQSELLYVPAVGHR